MLLSDRYEFIFFHVPKCAGRSVREALRPHARDPSSFWPNRVIARLGGRANLVAPARHRWLRQHTTARRARLYVPRAKFDRYFKFTFVRNPCDWLVSYYHFVIARPHHRCYRQLVACDGFEDFVRAQCKRPSIRQKDFVADRRGSVLVDSIGRFENLDKDFQSVCRRLGLDCQLGHRNISVHRDYREYYDRHLKSAVAGAFRADIEFFGYTFDGLPQRFAA
jgi:hypothetical protein